MVVNDYEYFVKKNGGEGGDFYNNILHGVLIINSDIYFW
jgi:hypothetical protein